MINDSECMIINGECIEIDISNLIQAIKMEDINEIIASIDSGEIDNEGKKVLITYLEHIPNDRKDKNDWLIAEKLGVKYEDKYDDKGKRLELEAILENLENSGLDDLTDYEDHVLDKYAKDIDLRKVNQWGFIGKLINRLQKEIEKYKAHEKPKTLH